MNAVSFPNGSITMAGNLYLPEGFAADNSYPAIVTVHPGGGVKEQTAGRYAEKLAAQGFVTLAYDASYQGESGGEPHFLEDPAARVADIHAAVDYLQSLDYVDAERIGVWGVCAGGGYAINATMTDARIKAVGTVSAVNIGSAWRKGWFGTDLDAAAVPTRDAASAQRAAEAQGGDPLTVGYVPEIIDEHTPPDLAEARDYYLTPRAQHPNAQNKYLLGRSIPRILAFDAFHLVEDLLTQPVLIVAGDRAGSLWHSTELHARARSPKRFVVVAGAAHMDFYDGPEYVDRAVAEAAPFFTENLQRATVDA